MIKRYKIQYVNAKTKRKHHFKTDNKIQANELFEHLINTVGGVIVLEDIKLRTRQIRDYKK